MGKPDSKPPGLLLDVAPPLIIYLVLTLVRVSPWIALGASIGVIAVRFGWLVARRRMSRRSVLPVVVFVVLAIVVSATDDRWLFLLKPVLGQLFLGITILATGRTRRRPYSLDVLCRLRRKRAADLTRWHDQDAGVRRRHRIVSRAWAIMLIGDGLCGGIILFTFVGRSAFLAFGCLSLVSVTTMLTVSLLCLRIPSGTLVHDDGRATSTVSASGS